MKPKKGNQFYPLEIHLLPGSYRTREFSRDFNIPVFLPAIVPLKAGLRRGGRATIPGSLLLPEGDGSFESDSILELGDIDFQVTILAGI